MVHNPLANTILGSGMPPVIDMLAAGIPVAISTDGSGSADNQNILAAARLAAQYQKALHQDATLLPSQQLLEMITVAPNRILRLNQGELAPGRQADWILVDLARPNLVPTRLDNVTENLLWAADGSEVDTVVASGRLLKLDGAVLPFLDGTRPGTRSWPRSSPCPSGTRTTAAPPRRSGAPAPTPDQEGQGLRREVDQVPWAVRANRWIPPSFKGRAQKFRSRPTSLPAKRR